MTPERWERVEKLYHAALEHEPAARPGFLAEACAGDAELCREVAGLLRYDDSQASFIEAPALEVAARALAGELSVTEIVIDVVGVVGRAALAGDRRKNQRNDEAKTGEPTGRRHAPRFTMTGGERHATITGP